MPMIRKDPVLPEATRNLEAVIEVEAAIRDGDQARATQLADAALAKGIEHPTLLSLRAARFNDEGLTEQAIADIRRALEIKPWDYTLPNALGMYLAKLGRFGEAMAALDQSIALEPRFANAHFTKGWVAEQMRDLDTAVQAYEGAVAANPNYSEALGALASVAAMRGQWDRVRAFGTRAVGLDKGQPTGEVAMACAEIAEGAPAAAEARLRKLLQAQPSRLSAYALAVTLGRLGDALAAQDRSKEAFAAYGQEKAMIRELHAPRFVGHDAGAMIETMIGWLQDGPAWPRPDDGGPLSQPCAQHVFLVGFPRSGDARLEQTLAGHPDVVILDERDVLAEAGQALLTSQAGLDRLAGLGPDELARLRGDYWRRVRESGAEPDGKVFIDRLPLNTIKLPLIAKLFPTAKVIFAVRDPRDVAVSCWRQHFDINAALFQLLTLDGEAAFYDRVMRLGEACREKLPLDQRRHRAEDLVADAEAEGRAVCDFIGLDWRAEMADAARTAKGDGETAGQWRAYAEALAPVLPALQPWADRFGYPAA